MNFNILIKCKTDRTMKQNFNTFAGVRMAVSLFALHRNPEVWSEPEVLTSIFRMHLGGGGVRRDEYFMSLKLVGV